MNLRSAGLVVALVLSAGCGGDNTSGPDATYPDLVGSWTYQVEASGSGWSCWIGDVDPVIIAVGQNGSGNLEMDASLESSTCVYDDGTQTKVFSGTWWTGTIASDAHVTTTGSVEFNFETYDIRNTGQVDTSANAIDGNVELVGTLDGVPVRLPGTFSMQRQ